MARTGQTAAAAIILALATPAQPARGETHLPQPPARRLTGLTRPLFSAGLCTPFTDGSHGRPAGDHRTRVGRA